MNYFLLCASLVPCLLFGQVNKDKVESLLQEDKVFSTGSFVVGYSTTSEINQFSFGERIENSKTLFNVASVSKTFTGLGILKLMQDKKIKPYDLIGKYIPELSPALGKVTIEQLAFHTNGIHDYFTLIPNHHRITNADVIDALVKLDSTVFEPGNNWGYTNSGYVLLAEIIENVTQEKYEVWMNREILVPLGLKTAVLFREGSSKPIYGHRSNGDLDSIVSFTSGGGNYLFTADDFQQFGKSLKTNKELKSLIQLSKERSKPWVRDSTWSSGYGMWHGSDEFGEFIAHSGRSYGYMAYYRYYTDKKLFLFYMTNQDCPNIKKFRKKYINYLSDL